MNGCNGLCCQDFGLLDSDLGEFQAKGITLEPTRIDANHVQHYDCPKWDKATKLCTIYEDRPDVCRTYPEIPKTCADCGMTGADYARPHPVTYPR